jgi:hypothetical protein
LPPPLDKAESLQGFQLDWSVDAGGQVIADRTPFQRYEGGADSYAGYPPYVTVGLGFGVGWWYGPAYPYRRGYPPLIRGYYYPPARARGGPWRGAPPGAWRAAPPPRGGWRGAPSAPSGGWRGSPPPGSTLRAPPVPRTGPIHRGGGGGGGWRGHH